MNTKTKLLLTLSQVEDIIKLVEGNEYEDYFTSHLIPIQVELNRQLTNLSHYTKIKE